MDFKVKTFMISPKMIIRERDVLLKWSENVERLCEHSPDPDPKYQCQIALNLIIICSLTS